MARDDHTILHYPLSLRSWRFRLVLAILILISVVRLIWGWHTAKLLQAEINRIHQRGEVAEISDLKFEKLPDAENAWLIQLKAVAAIVPGVNSPRSSNDTYRDYPPYPSYWMKRAAASEKAHAPVFVLMRQARSLPRSQIRSGFGSPAVSSVLTPYLNQMRNLANITSDAGLYAQVTGDDSEAIERTLDVMHLANSLRSDPLLVSQLVATGIDALATDNLQVIAPGLRFDPAATTRPATRDQARSAIAQLLDDEPIWQGSRASIAGEHAIAVDLIQWRASHNWMIKPLAEMEELRSQKWFENAIPAANARNAVEAKDLIARAPMEPSQRPNVYLARPAATPVVLRYSRWYYDWSDDLWPYFRTTFRIIAERRMTAVSLAAQLYRADHKHWPAKLEELVPQYLPAIPLDPFQSDGRPVGYTIVKGVLPNNEDRPLVYCEEAGAVDLGPIDEPMYGWQQPHAPPRPNAIRQYRDLTRFEPLKPPGTPGGNPSGADK